MRHRAPRRPGGGGAGPTPRDLASLSRCLERLPVLIDRLLALKSSDAGRAELAASRPFIEQQAAFLRRACWPSLPRTCGRAASSRQGSTPSSIASATLARIAGNGSPRTKRTLRRPRRTSVAEGRGYNKVFGYYIEVTNVHRDKAPPAWTRSRRPPTASATSPRSWKCVRERGAGRRTKPLRARNNRCLSRSGRRCCRTCRRFRNWPTAVGAHRRVSSSSPPLRSSRRLLPADGDGGSRPADRRRPAPGARTAARQRVRRPTTRRSARTIRCR